MGFRWPKHRRLAIANRDLWANLSISRSSALQTLDEHRQPQLQASTSVRKGTLQDRVLSLMPRDGSSITIAEIERRVNTQSKRPHSRESIRRTVTTLLRQKGRIRRTGVGKYALVVGQEER